MTTRKELVEAVIFWQRNYNEAMEKVEAQQSTIRSLVDAAKTARGKIDYCGNVPVTAQTYDVLRNAAKILEDAIKGGTPEQEANAKQAADQKGDSIADGC